MVVEELDEQQEEDDNEEINHYESNGSHKHDSCFDPSESEELDIATNTFDNQKGSKPQSPIVANADKSAAAGQNMSTFKKQAVAS